MARLEWIERRFPNWRRWKLARGSGALGYAAVNLENADMPRDPYADAPIPTSDIEASETDVAIELLPAELKETVYVWYLGTRGLAEKLRQLGCAEPTLHARIGKAHMLMAGHFTEKDEKRRLERQRVERLSASVRP